MLQSISDRITLLESQHSIQYRGEPPTMYSVLERLDVLLYKGREKRSRSEPPESDSEEYDSEESDFSEEKVANPLNTVEGIHRVLQDSFTFGNYWNGTFDSTIRSKTSGTTEGTVKVMIQKSNLRRHVVPLHRFHTRSARALQRNGNQDFILQQISSSPERQGHGYNFFLKLMLAASMEGRGVELQQCITDGSKALRNKLISKKFAIAKGELSALSIYPITKEISEKLNEELATTEISP